MKETSETSETSETIEERFVALQEFVPAARARLDDNAWGYIIGATETETSARRNRLAIESLALRPRVLNDVSSVDCSARLFGADYRLPIVLGPVGGLESFDPRGAAAVAEAAAGFGVPMLMSSVSRVPYDELVAQTSSATVIYQLYARSDSTSIDALIDQQQSLGATAFCVTVDSAVYSRRERDIVARFNKPWRASGEGDAAYYQAALNWHDIARIRSRFDGDLILKGIATAEDAVKALEHGVNTVYVSNHGGRQLDHTVGSFTMLEEIVAAVQQHSGSCSIVVDGGVYRGTDIAKALALGADGVGMGRLMCLALAAAGPAGIARMLALIETELASALALLGVTTVQAIDRSHVQRADPLPFGHSLHAAFPLLEEELFA